MKMKFRVQVLFIVLFCSLSGLSFSSYNPPLEKSQNQPLIVCIAGGTGAGKTTFANVLKKKLGDSAIVISQDSYYKDLSHLKFKERTLVNFDHPDSIEFSLLKKHLLYLRNGNSIQQPNYDFVTCTRTKKVTKVKPAKVVIVEGILLLASSEIRDLFDVKFFIDVEDDVRLLRRLKRDIKERGRTFESVESQYMDTVNPMYKMFVKPSKDFADLIIPKGGKNAVAIDTIVYWLKGKMKNT